MIRSSKVKRGNSLVIKKKFKIDKSFVETNTLESYQEAEQDRTFRKWRHSRFAGRGGNQADVRQRRFSLISKKDHPKLRCKYAPDMYSSTFFALTNEYKWKYTLTDAQIASHVQESFFVLALQFALTFLIIFNYNSKSGAAPSDIATLNALADSKLQAAQLISNTVLHYFCVKNVRNGLYMMQQTMYNRNAFAHPITGFLLGLMVCTLYMLVELLNATNLMKFKDFDTVLAKFVSYSILLNLPALYSGQRTGFNIKFDCADFFLSIPKPLDDEDTKDFQKVKVNRRDNESVSSLKDVKEVLQQKATIKIIKSVNTFYRVFFYIVAAIYQVVYFYLFQMMIFIMPMARVYSIFTFNINVIDVI